MFPEEIRKAYREVIQWLPKFQQATPDYAKCYPRGAFDSQSMLWDLSYFKYYYLKLAGVAFNEQLLEDDFHTLTSFLLQAYGDFFMYRDFQSRNIMMHQGHPWFIDYQGGRKGALQYDIVSLLYDAKADIPPQMRDELLEYYLEQLDVNKMPGGQVFLKFFPAFVLIRILQALGAYGFRGYYQKKQHFLQSIPYALRNLELLMRKPLNVKLPELMKVLTQMIIMGQIPTGTELRTASGTPHPKPIKNMLSSTVYPGPGKIPEPGNGVTENDAGREEHLTVSIHSFSYKKGLTVDTSGNGGGFIFDCRALPNPGRHEEYRDLTGKDREVIEYLQDEPDVAVFLNNVFTLVDQSVEIYIMRGFTHLMVSFGCTGGQHRSVYCAERLARHLKEKYSIRMLVTHREQMPAKGA
jgi:hypothetical protein